MSLPVKSMDLIKSGYRSYKPKVNDKIQKLYVHVSSRQKIRSNELLHLKYLTNILNKEIDLVQKRRVIYLHKFRIQNIDYAFELPLKHLMTCYITIIRSECSRNRSLSFCNHAVLPVIYFLLKK